MPIHDLGYRPWQGRRHVGRLNWLVIAHSGLRLAWKNPWLRRMLMVAWVPALTLGLCFFVYEQYSDDILGEGSELGLILKNVAGLQEEDVEYKDEELWDDLSRPHQLVPPEHPRRSGPLTPPIPVDPGDFRKQVWAVSPAVRHTIQSMLDDPQAARHDVWALLLLTFFQYPQGILMVLIVGLIAPQLISKDVRSRAFLLYFSRPIGRGEYILGKSIVVWCYLALITTVPALVLYVVGVFLSPTWTVVQDTWDLPLRILAASAVLLIPTTALALMFSSLTSETRYAGYAWFCVWALGWVTYLFLLMTEQFWTEVSLIHMLWKVEGWVFGLEDDFTTVMWPLIILVGLTVFSIVVINRRVSAPMRI